MYQRSLVGRLVGAVVVVVGCAVALSWAYALIKPMLWLVPVVCVGVAGVIGYRRWSGRDL
jgi:hypothetical protein